APPAPARAARRRARGSRRPSRRPRGRPRGSSSAVPGEVLLEHLADDRRELVLVSQAPGLLHEPADRLELPVGAGDAVLALRIGLVEPAHLEDATRTPTQDVSRRCRHLRITAAMERR